MANAPWINANVQFFDNSGLPLAAGKLYTYIAGGTTPQVTYTTATGSTANANPVILDSAGRANVWLLAASYRFDLKDSSNVLLWSVDNVTASALNAITTATANTALAGPTTGGAAVPTFRALVAADIPSLSISTKISGLGTNVAAFLGTPSGANLAAAVTGETGTGALVFGTSPTIVTPTIASLVNATHNHTNAAGGGLLNPLIHAATLISASGAIDPHTPAWYQITKAGVAVLTLAAPTVTTDDGVQLEIVNQTANAHTITTTSFLKTGSANVNVATFAAFAGASLVLRAYQGLWYVLAQNQVVFT